MACCFGLRIDKYCIRTFDMWLWIFSELLAVKEDDGLTFGLKGMLLIPVG